VVPCFAAGLHGKGQIEVHAMAGGEGALPKLRRQYQSVLHGGDRQNLLVRRQSAPRDNGSFAAFCEVVKQGLSNGPICFMRAFAPGFHGAERNSAIPPDIDVKNSGSVNNTRSDPVMLAIRVDRLIGSD